LGNRSDAFLEVGHSRRSLCENRRELISLFICLRFAELKRPMATLVDMNAQEFARLAEPIALIVDDEPLILMDTADMVAHEGYAIVEASSAQQAFEFLEKHSSLQLLLTDVQTPGTIDGFELARKVAERWPHIQVVVASGAAKPREADLPEGAIFISKPLSQELVHEVINQYGRIDTPV
jgi:CheY-like chemotaxis protein